MPWLAVEDSSASKSDSIDLSSENPRSQKPDPTARRGPLRVSRMNGFGVRTSCREFLQSVLP
jgi:hypothetical protein